MTNPNQMTKVRLFTRRNAFVVSLLALVVFTVSFFLPVIDLGLVQITGAKSLSFSFDAMLGKNEMLNSLSSLGSEYGDSSIGDLQGSYTLAWLKFSWLSNVAFLVAMTLLFLSRPLLYPAFVVALAAFVWAASGLINFDHFGESWHNFDTYSVGYYAWILSFLILVIASMLHPEADKQGTDA